VFFGFIFVCSSSSNRGDFLGWSENRAGEYYRSTFLISALHPPAERRETSVNVTFTADVYENMGRKYKEGNYQCGINALRLPLAQACWIKFVALSATAPYA
jgi:hypothetical protein